MVDFNRYDAIQVVNLLYLKHAFSHDFHSRQFILSIPLSIALRQVCSSAVSYIDILGTIAPGNAWPALILFSSRI